MKATDVVERQTSMYQVRNVEDSVHVVYLVCRQLQVLEVGEAGQTLRDCNQLASCQIELLQAQWKKARSDVFYGIV